MKNFFKKPLNEATLIVIALLIGAGIVYAAANSFTAPGSGTQTSITSNFGCQKVTNNNGPTLFVPANTSAEWNSFLNHLPSGVSVSSCCAGNYGQTCYSGYNDCGQRNSDTYDCSGNCPATTPADPSYYNQTCYSDYNSCGQRNSGTYDCGANCSASTPDNSGCPIYGCTDSDAFNYNSGANTNDGSCHYKGCIDLYVGQYDFSYYGGEAIDVCNQGVYGPDGYNTTTETCSSVSNCGYQASSWNSIIGVCDGVQSGMYVGVVESVGSPYSCNW